MGGPPRSPSVRASSGVQKPGLLQPTIISVFLSLLCVSGPFNMHICFNAAIPPIRNASRGNKPVDLFKDLIIRMFLAMFIVQISIGCLLSARHEEKKKKSLYVGEKNRNYLQVQGAWIVEINHKASL